MAQEGRTQPLPKTKHIKQQAPTSGVVFLNSRLSSTSLLRDTSLSSWRAAKSAADRSRDFLKHSTKNTRHATSFTLQPALSTQGCQLFSVLLWNSQYTHSMHKWHWVSVTQLTRSLQNQVPSLNCLNPAVTMPLLNPKQAEHQTDYSEMVPANRGRLAALFHRTVLFCYLLVWDGPEWWNIKYIKRSKNNNITKTPRKKFRFVLELQEGWMSSSNRS